jgi:hypothetical protein
MFRTLLLAAGLFASASATVGGNIRRMPEATTESLAAVDAAAAEPAKDLAAMTPAEPVTEKKDEIAPMFTKTGWVLGAVGLSCNAVCLAADGTCNAAATAAANSAAKLKYVVEEELEQAVGIYSEGNSAFNPSKSSTQTNQYNFNPVGSSTASTCDAAAGNDFRICCCNTDAAKCPVDGGLFGK